jgi:hypothetical protein
MQRPERTAGPALQDLDIVGALESARAAHLPLGLDARDIDSVAEIRGRILGRKIHDAILQRC